ncbi:hypothetical protein LWI28_007178 [Acer negundo]|uniref:Uncharacterized protein n=1 Tax=Acer negundo TaxID=4023 RepID=A0AAD5IG61_ACENE|nr:hypothetical protein LWI28_007178 [Acer negundo]
MRNQGAIVVPKATHLDVLMISFVNPDLSNPGPKKHKKIAKPTINLARKLTGFLQNQIPFPTRTCFAFETPSSSHDLVPNPFHILRFMSIVRTYIRERYWNDLQGSSYSDQVKTLKKSLSNSNAKTFEATKNAKLANLNNDQLEFNLANAELKATNAMQMAALAKKKAAELKAEAKLAKETLATAQHAILESW